jgi:dATP pyrophosphohydrolase
LNYFRVNCYCGCTKKEQFIAGGGEDEDETIIISAKREAYEEANIGMDCKYSVLDTQNSIPTYCFKEARKI